ncbi:MAG: NADP-specific glutamate dehydrogenase [Erysipelothrix sp.]|nr:NADP-specific glutamate dehydrogenase [Erysipelothrix sp.]
MHNILNEFHNKYKDEVQFRNTTTEFVDSIYDYLDEATLKMILHAERIITFRVPWVDDAGILQVNYGYRVQHSSALGPYKGGIRFHADVNLDMLKFLAFEQTFKNALTNLPLGGAKGGADFNPKGKTDHEIMKFCQSFMNELYRHIGRTIDIPAGDMGVGNKEIGYMFGQYKRLTRSYEGVFTGKDLLIGGAKGRPEATGYGLIYITEALLKTLNDDFKGKRVVVSGSGKVGVYAAIKAIEKGAKVIAMNDFRGGTIVDEDGLNLDDIKRIKLDENQSLKAYAELHELTLYDSAHIWEVPCDIALPCATQNEMNAEQLETLIKNGCKVIAEGANKPLTPEAVQMAMKQKLYYLPGKAANAGGVATSGIEMMQNAQMDVFKFKDVDARLQMIMQNIFETIHQKSIEVNQPYNYVVGANLVAYQRVRDAITLQGAV